MQGLTAVHIMLDKVQIRVAKGEMTEKYALLAIFAIAKREFDRVSLEERRAECPLLKIE